MREACVRRCRGGRRSPSSLASAEVMLSAASKSDSDFNWLKLPNEGDGHGLAERPPETEHDAADDAGLGVGQHVPPTLPRWGSPGVGVDSFSIGGDFEDAAHDGGDTGDDHDGQDDAGRQHPMPTAARKELAEDRNVR